MGSDHGQLSPAQIVDLASDKNSWRKLSVICAAADQW